MSQANCVLQIHRVERRDELGVEVRGPWVGEVSCVRTDKEADASKPTGSQLGRSFDSVLEDDGILGPLAVRLLHRMRTGDNPVNGASQSVGVMIDGDTRSEQIRRQLA